MFLFQIKCLSKKQQQIPLINNESLNRFTHLARADWSNEFGKLVSIPFPIFALKLKLNVYFLDNDTNVQVGPVVPPSFLPII